MIKIRKTSHILRLGTLTGLLLGASSGLSADITSMGTVDATSTGKVSSAGLLHPGSFALGLSFDGADNLNYSLSEELTQKLSSAHSTNVHFAYGLSKYFELGLSLRGTTEILNYDQRLEMYSGLNLEDHDGMMVKENAYAGSRLQVKIGLYDNGSFKLALAPFVEEGVGQKAKYSLTRSEKFQYGFLGLLTYGNPGAAEVNVNLGMRYRDPVELGQYTLRNEGIGKINVKAFINNDISVFLGANARRLMIADRKQQKQDEVLSYEAQTNLEVLFGAGYQMSDMMFSAYAGRDLNKDELFHTGDQTFGLSMNVVFGDSANKRSFTDKEKSQSKDWDPKMKKKKSKVIDEYPEMEATIDPIADMPDGEGDDFDRLQKQMKKNRKDGVGKSGLSVDEEVEQELAELKSAEEKVQAEKNRQEESESAKLDRIRKGKVEQKRKARLSKKASKLIDKNYGIDASDVSWNGLDD